ncbi:MAG: lytic transglycosylase domain-containing protein [Treponema sp.]|nr:lytic transglycosylase domain-containing protein [Treponema sp.]
MKFIIPLFTGVLCSLIVCLFIGLSFGHFKNTTPAITINYEEEDISLLFAPTEVIPDAVLEYFRNPEYRDWVIDFFAGLCSSQEIAYAILDSSDEFNVPPALSFALCWEESRFNPNAINRQNRNGSIDRGLFQLNSQSFPHLDVSVFYSINSNARYGVGYLNQCLSWGGSEISALAMYNAGAGRVRSTGAPEITLNYISRILENRRKIESRFHSRLIKEEEMRLNERSMNAAAGGLFGRAF